uniref:Uncharacterized protein n=1 Tax=Mus musculus TaxID=10090 RepID=Q3UQY2_MOUSE|nr:unnamed protein product [Mus musculus]
MTKVYRHCVALLTAPEPNRQCILYFMCTFSVSYWIFYIPFLGEKKKDTFKFFLGSSVLETKYSQG